jgi:hypothetical protein
MPARPSLRWNRLTQGQQAGPRSLALAGRNPAQEAVVLLLRHLQKAVSGSQRKKNKRRNKQTNKN